MRVLVTGSRDWDDAAVIANALVLLNQVPGAHILVNGGARGADTLAANAAASLGWIVETHVPDWSMGNHAGHIRNDEMLDTNPDIVLAFIKNESPGATSCHRKALRRGLLTLRWVK